MEISKTYKTALQANVDCEACGDLRTVTHRDPLTLQISVEPCPDCMPQPDAPVVRTSDFMDEPTLPDSPAALSDAGTPDTSLPPQVEATARTAAGAARRSGRLSNKMGSVVVGRVKETTGKGTK